MFRLRACLSILLCSMMWGSGSTLFGGLEIVGTRLTVLGTEKPQVVQYAPPGGHIQVFNRDVPAGEGFQWYFDQAPLPGDTNPATLTLSNIQFSDAGYYHLRAADGRRLESFELSVLDLSSDHVDTSFTADLDDGWVVDSDQTGALYVGIPASDPVTLQSWTRYIRLRANGEVDAGYSLPRSAGAILEVSPDWTVFTAHSPYRFDPTGAPQPLVLPTNIDPVFPLSAARIDAHGRILLAHSPQKPNRDATGFDHYWRLFRLNADGSVDETFSFGDARPGILQRVELGAGGNSLVGYRSNVLWPLEDREHFIVGVSASGSTISPILEVTDREVWGVDFARTSTGDILIEENGYYARRVQRYDSTGNLLNPDSVLGIAPAASWILLPDDTLLHSFDGQIVRRSLETFAVDPGFFLNDTDLGKVAPTANVRRLHSTQDGKLIVQGYFDHWSGHPTQRLVRLDLTAVNASAAPPGGYLKREVTRDGVSDNFLSIKRHDAVVLEVMLDRPKLSSVSWVAIDAQTLPEPELKQRLVYPDFDPSHLGSVGVKVGNANGVAVLQRAWLEASGSITLTNLSARVFRHDGAGPTILGFTLGPIPEFDSANILLRAVGPTLADFGVSSPIEDPRLTLVDERGAVLGGNDNWMPLPANRDPAVFAGAFPLNSSRNDAAMSHAFTSGGRYTAHLDSNPEHQESGLMLGEVYAVERGFGDKALSSVPLRNLSVLGFSGADDDVLIGGFVIKDEAGFTRPLRLLIRVIGPTLADYGVEGYLIDPQLEIFNHEGQRIVSNDNWHDGDSADLIAAVSATVGAFSLPAKSLDAAAVITLPAGAYTVMASSRTGETGTALVEVYLAE